MNSQSTQAYAKCRPFADERTCWMHSSLGSRQDKRRKKWSQVKQNQRNRHLLEHLASSHKQEIKAFPSRELQEFHSTNRMDFFEGVIAKRARINRRRFSADSPRETGTWLATSSASWMSTLVTSTTASLRKEYLNEFGKERQETRISPGSFRNTSKS